MSLKKFQLKTVLKLKYTGPAGEGGRRAAAAWHRHCAEHHQGGVGGGHSGASPVSIFFVVCISSSWKSFNELLWAMQAVASV